MLRPLRRTGHPAKKKQLDDVSTPPVTPDSKMGDNEEAFVINGQTHDEDELLHEAEMIIQHYHENESMEEQKMTMEEKTHPDPPAAMMRSSSLQAHQVVAPPVINDEQTTSTTIVPTTPPSLVNSMLQMVDMSCVASGLVPEEEQQQQQQHNDTMIVMEDDTIDEETTMSVPEWGKPPGRPKQRKRQENFELVYQEPTTARKSTNAALWKRWFRPTKTNPQMGIAKREAQSVKRDKSTPPSPAAVPSVPKSSTRSGFLRKAFRTSTTTTVSPPESTKKEVAVVPVRQLQSIKSPILETVPEEDLQVSVPGDPHTILCGKDLIGSEVVEEIYTTLEEQETTKVTKVTSVKQHETPKTKERTVTPDIPETKSSENLILSETTQVVYSSSPKRSTSGGYQKFESDNEEEADLFPTSEADDEGILRTRSWKEKLGLSKSSSSNDSKPTTKPQTNSKPMWKAVVDPATGRTYYYHRKTRETTWNKPNDEDLIIPKKIPAAQQNVQSAENAEIQRLLGLLPGEKGAELVKQHSGAVLIQKLQDLVESSSQPFDEPVAKTAQQQRTDERSVANKTLTASTIMSGFSSHKSRISEMTEPIKNTTRQKQVPHQQVANPVSPRPAIPRNIPVPRLRELEVEEFNSTRVERGTPSIRKLRNPPRLLGTQIDKDTTRSTPVKLKEDDANYMGDAENDHEWEGGADGEDDDDRESYAATDSISALSEDNLSYSDRKEAYDDARRRALQRAIAQQDWDLAAQMTSQLKERPPAKPTMVTPKHAVSEIDRLMAENNWTAVSVYIENAKNRARETQRQRINRHLGRTAPPQKRFGARSQLQHIGWNSDLEEVEGDDESESLGLSEGSSESNSPGRRGLAPPRARARKPREFAC